MKILLVEDDPYAHAAAKRVLEREGHEVHSAHDGWHACDAIERELFDAAVVDFQMPGPNGLEVLRLLTQRQPQCARILSSGALDLNIAVDAVNRSEVGFVLPKPHAPHELLEAVERASQRRERERTSAQHRPLEGAWLDDCFHRDLLQMAVQPILRTVDGSLFGVEALLRSSHTHLSSALDVVRAAQAFGRLDELGTVVVRGASRWLERLPEDVRVFINLHAEELQNPSALFQRLALFGSNSHRVVIEITEQSDVGTSPQRRRTVCELAEAGFAIAVDDLGAGYSSLSMLADLAPSIIKLDMSIVRDVDSDPRKRRLMHLLCRFADATGAHVVAEGIETDDELEAAVGCGVHLVQGYRLGRPSTDPATADTWVTRQVHPEALTRTHQMAAARA